MDGQSMPAENYRTALMHQGARDVRAGLRRPRPCRVAWWGRRRLRVLRPARVVGAGGGPRAGRRAVEQCRLVRRAWTRGAKVSAHRIAPSEISLRTRGLGRPEHQRRGVAKQLYGAALGSMRAAGMQHVLVGVGEGNVPACRAYAKVGFRRAAPGDSHLRCEL